MKTHSFISETSEQIVLDFVGVHDEFGLLQALLHYSRILKSRKMSYEFQNLHVWYVKSLLFYKRRHLTYPYYLCHHDAVTLYRRLRK